MPPMMHQTLLPSPSPPNSLKKEVVFPVIHMHYLPLSFQSLAAWLPVPPTSKIIKESQESINPVAFPLLQPCPCRGAIWMTYRWWWFPSPSPASRTPFYFHHFSPTNPCSYPFFPFSSVTYRHPPKILSLPFVFSHSIFFRVISVRQNPSEVDDSQITLCSSLSKDLQCSLVPSFGLSGLLTAIFSHFIRYTMLQDYHPNAQFCSCLPSSSDTFHGSQNLLNKIHIQQP